MKRNPVPGGPSRQRATNPRSIGLLELCRTATFGPLALGCTEKAMKDALGEPNAWANQPARGENYCHYGDVQFFFFDNELWLVHIDWFSGERGAPVLNDPHHLEPWVLRAGLAVQEAQTHLEDAGVGYSRRDDHSPALQLESGVMLNFDLSDGELNTLGAISLRTQP